MCGIRGCLCRRKDRRGARVRVRLGSRLPRLPRRMLTLAAAGEKHGFAFGGVWCVRWGDGENGKWKRNVTQRGEKVLKIGVFSVLSQISIHMLRHYDEIDLL